MTTDRREKTTKTKRMRARRTPKVTRTDSPTAARGCVLRGDERRAVRRVLMLSRRIIEHFHRPDIAFALNDGSLWTFREATTHIRAAETLVRCKA